MDALALYIGRAFFQLGVESGLSIAALENIQSNNHRNLVAQNREVLFTWRDNRTVKPTIRVLAQVFVNIGIGVRCLEEVLKNVDLNTLGNEEVIHKGTIFNYTNNKSKEIPQRQKKLS